MDLFVDEYYKIECENQIDYYDLLYPVRNTAMPAGYNAIGIISIVHADLTLKFALITGSGFIQKTATGKYCHDVQITSSLKKVILE